MTRKNYFVNLVMLVFLLTTFTAFSGGGQEVSGEADDSFKAALVLNQRSGDLGVVDRLINGIKKAEEELGVEIKILESRDATEYKDNILAMAMWGADVIFTSFAPLAKPAVAVAKDYPDTKFVLIYASYENPPSNVQSVLYDDASVFYLAGVEAAMATKTNKVALGVGADVPEAQKVFKAFSQGTKSINSDIDPMYAVYGSFEDVSKAKEVARTTFDQGVDVFCEWGGKVGWGSLEAAAETENYIVGLGGYVDMRSHFPGVIIGQMGVQFGEYVYQVINDLLSGKEFNGGTTVERNIQTGDVGFTFPPSTDEGFTDLQVLQLEEISKKLATGEIMVNLE